MDTLIVTIVLTTPIAVGSTLNSLTIGGNT